MAKGGNKKNDEPEMFPAKVPECSDQKCQFFCVIEKKHVSVPSTFVSRRASQQLFAGMSLRDPSG